MHGEKLREVELMFRVLHAVGRYGSDQSDLASVVGEFADVLGRATLPDRQRSQYETALRRLRLEHADVMAMTVTQHQDRTVVDLVYSLREIARERLRALDEE